MDGEILLKVPVIEELVVSWTIRPVIAQRLGAKVTDEHAEAMYTRACEGVNPNGLEFGAIHRQKGV